MDLQNRMQKCPGTYLRMAMAYTDINPRTIQGQFHFPQENILQILIVPIDLILLTFQCINSKCFALTCNQFLEKKIVKKVMDVY